MSLNNSYVKIFKINILLGKNDKEKYIISEIENSSFDKEFKEIKRNNIYKKVGKNVKNYNEIDGIKDKKLDEYYEDKKVNIKIKLNKFFNRDNNGNCLSFEGMTRLIRISPNIAYTQNDIESLLELIHFKYFDVKKVDEFYEITYNNIIVEEVLKEIYYSFIYDNQNVYEKLLNYDVIKGGGKGCCLNKLL